MNLNSRQRWALIALLCASSAAVAWLLMDWSGYVQSWVGAVARTASGMALTWAMARYALKIDLSVIRARVYAAFDEHHARTANHLDWPDWLAARELCAAVSVGLAGIALAIVVGLGGLAVAFG
jgi:hypothetical protein